MTIIYIVLLRAINAGGVNSLPMKDFVQIQSIWDSKVSELIFTLAMPFFATTKWNPQAASDLKSVHLTFLTSAPMTPDLITLEGIRESNERFALKGRVFYLHVPEGMARSRLFTGNRKVAGCRRHGTQLAHSLQEP
jgi:uncharacterized protein (DUF1697 family)